MTAAPFDSSLVISDWVRDLDLSFNVVRPMWLLQISHQTNGATDHYICNGSLARYPGSQSHVGELYCSLARSLCDI